MDPLAAAALAAAQAQMTATDPGNTAALDFNLFAGFYTAIVGPLLAASDQMVVRLLTELVPVTQALIIIYFMLLMAQALVGVGPAAGDPVMSTVRAVIRVSVVTAALQAANFHQIFVNLFLNDLPNNVSAAMTAALGGQPLDGGALFDKVWGQSYHAALDVYKLIPFSLSWFLLASLIVIFLLMALATLAIAFLMFLSASVLAVLVVTVGPLFVIAALFEQTRSWFSAWLSALVSTAVSKILIVTLMALLMKVEQDALLRVAAAGANSNPAADIIGLFGVGAILGIGAMLAWQLPSVAFALGGGVYHSMSPYLRTAGGLLSGGAGAVAAASAPAERLGGMAGAALRGSGGPTMPTWAAPNLGRGP